jgi:hypothetical protein
MGRRCHVTLYTPVKNGWSVKQQDRVIARIAKRKSGGCTVELTRSLDGITLDCISSFVQRHKLNR